MNFDSKYIKGIRIKSFNEQQAKELINELDSFLDKLNQVGKGLLSEVLILDYKDVLSKDIFRHYWFFNRTYNELGKYWDRCYLALEERTHLVLVLYGNRLRFRIEGGLNLDEDYYKRDDIISLEEDSLLVLLKYRQEIYKGFLNFIKEYNELKEKEKVLIKTESRIKIKANEIDAFIALYHNTGKSLSDVISIMEENGFSESQITKSIRKALGDAEWND